MLVQCLLFSRDALRARCIVDDYSLSVLRVFDDVFGARTICARRLSDVRCVVSSGLLLSDVFEEFLVACIDYYELGPSHYMSCVSRRAPLVLMVRQQRWTTLLLDVLLIKPYLERSLFRNITRLRIIVVPLYVCT